MTAAPATAVKTECPACGRPTSGTFAEYRGVPVHTNVLCRTREEALAAARGDVMLALCDACGLVWNVAFDPTLLEYDRTYENSLHFSPTFQRYAEALADRLIERYDLRNKRVVEIGSGKGEFLTLIEERGGNHCVGFDPSYDGESDTQSRVQFVRELYTEGTAIGAPDLVVCRHVLEHIEDPLAFLKSIRRSVGADTVVYFEVPAAEHVLREHGVWDVIYAHVTVFGEAALRTVFARAGFEPLATGFAFGRQYLWVEARARRSATTGKLEDASDLRSLATSFREALDAKRSYWAAQLAGAEARVALWGAGAKGTTFLNLVRTSDRIGVVVDVNPRKQGMHVPGTGQPIVAPPELAAFRPERVLVTNSVYRDEVSAALRERGLTPRLDSV